MLEMFMKNHFFVLVGCVLALTSCATILNDKEPLVDISSEPAGAEVYVDGEYVGITPVEVPLSVHSNHTVVFRKEGYADRRFTVSNEVGVLWIILDVVTGLVPLIIDAVTGDWLELKDDTVNVVLTGDGS